MIRYFKNYFFHLKTKTSLVSSLAFAVSGRFLRVGVAGEATEQLSLQVKEIPILQDLALIDTPGIENNIKDVYEKYLYYGGISPGYNIKNHNPKYLRPKELVPIEEQVHCVVLLMSADHL